MMTDNSSDSESSDDSIAGNPSTPGTSASNNSTKNIYSSIQKLITKASPEKAQLPELIIYSPKTTKKHLLCTQVVTSMVSEKIAYQRREVSMLCVDVNCLLKC